ncbi:MAG: restriction endonuclease subunit S [Thiothrix sp.]
MQHQISWNEGTGTTVSNVRIPTLKALKIPRYWCNEEKIGTILGSIADKIALNTQTNQTLEQIAQAIFKSWFVDFDPVKAKMTALAAGGSREDAERAAMCAISGKDESALDAMQREQPAAYAELAATAALFPAAMRASELGDVPEGWGVGEIGQEVEVIGGSTPSTKNADFWERGNIHWTTPKDLSNLTDKILIDTDRKITDLGLKEISSGLLSVNTVLMSSRAPVGYLAINKIPLAINQGYIAMRCNGRLSPEYVLQWANSVMDEIKQRSSGTTFAEISKKNFRTISVIVPDAGVIELFSDKVSKLYDAITENLFQTKSLTELRDSLLPKLLSGEIDLSNLPDNINEANA